MRQENNDEQKRIYQYCNNHSVTYSVIFSNVCIGNGNIQARRAIRERVMSAPVHYGRLSAFVGKQGLGFFISLTGMGNCGKDAAFLKENENEHRYNLLPVQSPSSC